ncbi:hypothetical protein WJS89_05030 [Sphingomicrobium sp. XHP0235]|uniref:hypothetical protein n=1 Tax=Sphingomicrobium aquimarinum TaxID=3133971 RepID=UPI0031FE4C67
MRGFSHILWTLGAGVAVLTCYLVSLEVASSRAELERVERDIALAMREVRTLETEIGTRGRLAQLERWNVNFLQLSAPDADQFVGSAYTLASMVRPEDADDRMSAPLVLAAAPDGEASGEAGELFVQASYTPSEASSAKPKAAKVEGAGPQGASPANTVSATPKSATSSTEKSRDPLAPLPEKDDNATP